MKNNKKISKTQQRTAASILTAFMFIKDMDEFRNTWDQLYHSYELQDDPFTYTPCSTDDYYKFRLEFDKQIMMEMYGHCDGLD